MSTAELDEIARLKKAFEEAQLAGNRALEERLATKKAFEEAQQAARVELEEAQQAARDELEEYQQAAKKKFEDAQLAAKKAFNEKLANAETIAEANACAASVSACQAARAAVNRPAPPRRPQQFSVFKGLGFRITSPSYGCGILYQDNLVSFTMRAEPHLDSLRGLSCASSLQLLSTAYPDSLLDEESLHVLATKFTPAWVEAIPRNGIYNGSSHSATTLFCGKANPPKLPNFPILPWKCMPGLLTQARVFRPGFNGEVKSAMSRGEHAPSMFDELLTYVFLGTAASLFGNVPTGHRRFFSYPPVGFGLAAFPHVGYLVAVEWIGKLFVSVVSQPFFLGSPEHEAAIAALPDRDYSGDVVDLRLDDVRVQSWSANDSAGLTGTEPEWPPSVLWSDESSRGPEGDEIFFKIILCNALKPDYFERMFEAYQALAEAFDEDKDSDPPPASLVPARMLFGAAEVCVTMPWVGGRDAVAADLQEGGCAVLPVAEAIAWLARRGIVYIDLRPPNVRVEEREEEGEEKGKGAAAGAGSAAATTSQASRRRVVLIDYDDLKVATTTQGLGGSGSDSGSGTGSGTGSCTGSDSGSGSGSGSKRRPCSFSTLMQELDDAAAPWAMRNGGLTAVLDALERLMGE